MSRYFITCIGRSGSRWLSRLLNQAAGHRCGHEDGDLRSKVIPQPWTPFPVERWAGETSYGEVNGMLRYHLSAQHLGREMEIPGRIYLRRNPLDIIASWMRGGRLETELSATCHEVLWHAANLEGWAQFSGSRVVEVESLWQSVTATQSLVNSLGLELVVTADMLAPDNKSLNPHQYVWTPDRLAIATRSASRVGYQHPLSSVTG